VHTNTAKHLRNKKLADATAELERWMRKEGSTMLTTMVNRKIGKTTWEKVRPEFLYSDGIQGGSGILA